MKCPKCEVVVQKRMAVIGSNAPSVKQRSVGSQRGQDGDLWYECTFFASICKKTDYSGQITLFLWTEILS